MGTGTTKAQEHEQMPIQEIAPDSYRVAYEGDPLAPVCEAQTEEEARRSDEVAEHRTEGYGKVAFFLMLNVGLILTAVAMVLFKTPNHLAFGGTTGVAIVLGALFPQLPVSSFMWVLNVALVILGFVFLDRKAMIWSSFASIALSAYVSLFEWIFPVTQSITGDLTLDVCFAVLLPALGSLRGGGHLRAAHGPVVHPWPGGQDLRCGLCHRVHPPAQGLPGHLQVPA